MTRQAYLVKVRYCPRLDQPSLVMAGANAGLVCLSAWFQELAKGGYRKVLLRREPWVHLSRDTSVAVAVEPFPRGPIAEARDNWKLLWGITPAQATLFSAQVKGLLERAQPGHVKLDNGLPAELQVVVALDEENPGRFR